MIYLIVYSIIGILTTFTFAFFDGKYSTTKETEPISIWLWAGIIWPLTIVVCISTILMDMGSKYKKK